MRQVETAAETAASTCVGRRRRDRNRRLVWGHHGTASSAGCQTNKTSLFVNGSLWVFLPSKCQTKTTSLFVNGSLWVCQRVQNIRKWIFPSNAEQKRLYDCQQNMVRTRCNAARRTLFTSTVIASDRTLCSRSTVGYGRRFDGCSTGGIHKRQLLAVTDAAVRFQFHRLSHEAASRAARWGEKDGTKKTVYKTVVYSDMITHDRSSSVGVQSPLDVRATASP